MPFETIWMDLGVIILNEVSQRQIYNITYLESKKRQMNLFTKQK